MADETAEVALQVGDKALTLKGAMAVVILVLLVVLGFVSYLFWDTSKKNVSQDLEAVSQQHMQKRLEMQALQTTEHKAIVEAVQSIRSDHVALGEALKEVNKTIKVQNYIILADEKERDRIKRKLQMPPELKREINGGD